MGNTRGNIYSKNHVSFDTCSSCADFWNFCFDDSGVKDYAAEIDYIMDHSYFAKVNFVGHSMGATQYVVSISLKLVNKISVLHGIMNTELRYKK